MDLLAQWPPGWYITAGFVWSIYQGVRGAREQRLTQPEAKDTNWTLLDKYVIFYIHDFAFRFICTAAGFLALYVSCRLSLDVEPLRGLSPGAALLLIFSFLIGVIGVGGQLHYVILMGKWPPK
jgi:hypothetical protein